MSLTGFKEGNYFLNVEQKPFDELKTMSAQDSDDSLDEDELNNDNSLQGFIKVNDMVLLKGERPIMDFSADAF